MPWEQSITSLTLALFEDTGKSVLLVFLQHEIVFNVNFAYYLTGWYKANFSASPGTLSPAPFGYGAGCSFLTDDCITDDNIPEFGKNVFCNTLASESPIRCDVSHRRMAKCDLIDYSTYANQPVYSYLTAPSAPGTEYHHFKNTVRWTVIFVFGPKMYLFLILCVLLNYRGLVR